MRTTTRRSSPFDHLHEAIEHHLSAVLGSVETDPLFRRRLRTEVVNGFAGARERARAAEAVVSGGSGMGRLGRACLYASFALAVTGAGVLGASQRALPGEPFYELKLQIEELRAELVPPEARAELAAYALATRIEEMAQLAADGRWSLVHELAVLVDAEYDRLSAARELGIGEGALDRHFVVLDGLLGSLPAPAREAVEGVIDGGDVSPPLRGPVPAQGIEPARVGSGGAQEPTPRPPATEEPEGTAQPEKPERSPAAATPEPTPRPDAPPRSTPSAPARPPASSEGPPPDPPDRASED